MKWASRRVVSVSVLLMLVLPTHIEIILRMSSMAKTRLGHLGEISLVICFSLRWWSVVDFDLLLGVVRMVSLVFLVVWNDWLSSSSFSLSLCSVSLILVVSVFFFLLGFKFSPERSSIND